MLGPRATPRGQEPQATERRGQAPIEAEMESGRGEEQCDEDEGIDDCDADVGRSRVKRPTQPLRGRPDDEREQDAGNVGEIAEETEQQRERDQSLPNSDRMGEDLRIDVDDVHPEVDPAVNYAGFTRLSTADIAREVGDEVRLPLEPGVDAPYPAKDDAQDADPLQPPGGELGIGRGRLTGGDAGGLTC